jgi:hypothetical protein
MQMRSSGVSRGNKVNTEEASGEVQIADAMMRRRENKLTMSQQEKKVEDKDKLKIKKKKKEKKRREEGDEQNFLPFTRNRGRRDGEESSALTMLDAIFGIQIAAQLAAQGYNRPFPQPLKRGNKHPFAGTHIWSSCGCTKGAMISPI